MLVIYIGQKENMAEFKGVEMELFDPFKYKNLFDKVRYIEELSLNISAIILDLRYKNIDEYDLLLLQIAYTKSVPVFAIDPRRQIYHEKVQYSTCLEDLLHCLYKFMGA